MKQLLVFLLIVLGVGIFIVSKSFFPYSISSQVKKTIVHPAPVVASSSQTILFVPYWTMDGKAISSQYAQAVYFGITANTSGIDTEEDGYKGISQFVQSVSPSQRTILAIRLLDQNIDEKVLHDSSFQQKIITQSLDTAHRYRFDGVLLDFEYKALAFDEVVQSVNNLSDKFSQATHASHMLFYDALYGDTVYRLRPYDISHIGKVSDGVYVLAYDFHKASGNPGPNFPLGTLPDEDYNFSEMIGDFSQKIPVSKLTIVFGLFGYDWTIDNKNQSIGMATTITAQEAQQKFFPSCSLSQCRAKHDSIAAETEVTYQGVGKALHEVWFEDMQSVLQKENLLHKKSITSTALWSYSYF